MGDMNPGQQPDRNIPAPDIRGRSVGQKMAFFMVPLLVFFLILMGTAAFIRSASLLQASSQTEMRMTTEAVLSELEAWSESRELWLHKAENPAVRESITAYLNSPGETTKVTLLQELEAIRFYGENQLFSEIAVLRIDSPSPSVLIATNSAWETSAPPSFIGLPEDRASSTLLPDEPVISPGGLGFISSLPLDISGNPDADVLILGICIDEAASSLLVELQNAAQDLKPEALSSSSLYLAFRPDRLIPINATASTAETLSDSTHPAFGAGGGGSTLETTYRSASGTMLTAVAWDAEGVGIVLDTPLEAGMQSLLGLGAFLAALVFIGALLSTIVVILAARQLLRPLPELVGYAQEISRGNWNQRLDESGTDEFGAIARTFNQMVNRLSALYQSLEARVEDRTRQIRTASEVARTATSSPSLEDLLQRAVNLIADRFSYISVSIYFLSTDGQKAILKESSSDTGKALIARDYSVPLDTDTIIGWVASAAQPHLSRIIRSDPLHIPEILLPGTKSEIVLPLQFGGRILGVLDVQGSTEDSFKTEYIEILTTLADELSAAIHNATLAQVSATVAARARLITEITGRLSGVLDVDQVLETTADALHTALGHPEVLVRMTPENVGAEQVESPDASHPSAETLQTPIPDSDEDHENIDEGNS